MAHLSNPPGFGTNSWSELPWAKSNAMTGPRFTVADAGSWRPTVSTTADRTVVLARGAAVACGVYDETNAAATVQFDPNSTGSNRYDYVVATWDWSTRNVIFNVIKGGLSVPQGNVIAPAQDGMVNRIPGVQYDAVIGLLTVRPNVGTFLSGDLLDLRVWGGGFGAANTSSNACLPYLDAEAGDEVIASNTGICWQKTPTSWRPADGNWGEGVTFPTDGVREGDKYQHNLLRCTFSLRDTVWRQQDMAYASNSADLRTFRADVAAAGLGLHDGFQVYQSDVNALWLSSGGTNLRPVGVLTVLNRVDRELLSPFNGMRVYQNDINAELVYTGNHWELAKAKHYSTVSTNGTVMNPSLAWQGSEGWNWVPDFPEKITVPADGIGRQWEIVGTAHVAGDMRMRLRIDILNANSVTTVYRPGATGSRIIATPNTEETLTVIGSHYQAPDKGVTFFLEAIAPQPGAGSIFVPQLSATAF